LLGDKFDILKDGETCCETLGISFNEVYKRTNTSYKPIWITYEIDQSASGKWYSDYKSASSVERVEAFIKLGCPDPCEYADENGPVTWEHVLSEVTKVLDNHTENK
jgi:7-cyano-7-deazaguanine synthase